MPAGSMRVYDSALNSLLAGTLPQLETASITALLLGVSHSVNLAEHACLADIEAEEITGFDYARKRVTGGRVEAGLGGSSFTSDIIHFGNPVTLGPARYMAFVFGRPGGLTAESPLLGIAELAEGSAVEAQRSGFAVHPPLEGWFKLISS